MKYHLFETPEEMATGLQYRESIDDDTVYLFPTVEAGMVFHSRNVPEPFDIAFLSLDRTVLLLRRIHPEAETVTAPGETAIAIEAKAGLLDRYGLKVGARCPF